VMDAGLLGAFLASRRITMIWITAGVFQQIAAVDPQIFAGDRVVLTGGDVVNPDAARSVLAACVGSGLRLLNGYGPTENTTFSTVFDIAALDHSAPGVPIGRPIANSTVYILDPRGRPLPIGVTGEIYVGGDGVATGYVGDAERTAERFLPDPFAVPIARRARPLMYRTGDLGRWRGDGTVLFVGRADEQVKVRGFRIEPNEIAAALAQHPDVAEVCIVVPRRDGGERQLVAYLVAKPGRRPSPAVLHAFLADELPPQMLPHAYVALDALPLTINGKVDRAALPSVDERHYVRSGEVVAPRSEEERLLAAIWCDLLGLTAVGVHDNFFHAGGDSILAIRLVARATEAGLPLTPRDVFDHQTIERLAAAAARQRSVRISGPRFHPLDLVPAACDEDGAAPFALASLALDRRIGSMELGLAIQRLAERHEALRLRIVGNGTSRRLGVMDFLAAFPIRAVAAPDLTDKALDEWVAARRDRLGRDLGLAVGITIAAALVDRGSARNPVVILAVHRAISDDRAMALLAAELECELTLGSAAPERSAARIAYGDWLDWLERHAASEPARSGLEALEADAMRRAGSVALDQAAHGLDAVRATLILDPAIALSLTERMPARLGITPLDALVAALSAALAPEPNANDLLIEAIDGDCRMPDGAPDMSGMLGNRDAVLPILVSTTAQSAEARLKAAKSARQAVAATGVVYRVLARTFDLPPASLGIAWQAPRDAHGALRLHSPPDFGASIRRRTRPPALDWDRALGRCRGGPVPDRGSVDGFRAHRRAGDRTPLHAGRLPPRGS
jgi:hypothetical protein